MMSVLKTSQAIHTQSNMMSVLKTSQAILRSVRVYLLSHALWWKNIWNGIAKITQMYSLLMFHSNYVN